jgi:ABC-type transport system involved in multi-copper enzyme maturation permease subunit
MNATSLAADAGPTVATDRASLLGLGPLVRKDLSEWRRGRRAVVTLLAVVALMAVTAANGAINHWAVAQFPKTADLGALVSVEPMDNFLKAIGTQFSVVAAVFATMGLIVGERDAGTLAWTASKPVARHSIWLSKWITSGATLLLVAVVAPVVVTAALVTMLYGPLDPGIVVLTIVGLGASVLLFTAIGLATGAYARSQAVVVAIGLGAMVVPNLVAGVYAPLNDVLPTSILGWALGVGTGQAVSWATPIAWLAAVALIAAVGIRRMRTMEF